MMPPETIYIYTLSDETGVKYVGQAKNPKDRLVHHKCDGSIGRNKTPCGQWIKELMDNGKVPIMTIIEECDTTNSYKREAYWRWYYRKQGCDLLNMKSGPKPKRQSVRILPEEEQKEGQKRDADATERLYRFIQAPRAV